MKSEIRRNQLPSPSGNEASTVGPLLGVASISDGPDATVGLKIQSVAFSMSPPCIAISKQTITQINFLLKRVG